MTLDALHTAQNMELPREQALQLPAGAVDFVFIVGVSRSGTTLMRFVLNQSDWIAIARENHYLGHVIGSEGARHKFRKFGDLSKDENVRRLVDFIYGGGMEESSKMRKASSHWRWITRRIEQQHFLERLLATPRQEKDFFRLLMMLYSERKGKVIAGEKTPAHVRYVPTLMEWFPQGKVIHMLRDPRAVYVSELKRRAKEADSTPYKQLRAVYPLFALYILLETTFAWWESVQLLQANATAFGARYRVQKFEDLVQQPEAQIRSICDDLGVPFQEKMLEQEVVSKGITAGQQGFDAAAATRWKKLIGKMAAAWFGIVFRAQLQEFGYEPQ